MTSRPGTYDAGPHLPPSGPGGRPRGVINPKRATGAHRKDATSTPTFRRTHHHLPEDGLGGSDWYVTFRRTNSPTFNSSITFTSSGTR